jgi:hypothetical protein
MAVLKFHSTVGLISNSSTTIISYVTGDTETHVRGFLKKVMDSLGVHGEVDDYFDVGICVDTYMMNDYMDVIYDEIHDRLIEEDVLTEDEAALGWNELDEAARDKVLNWAEAHPQDWAINEDGEWLWGEDNSTGELYITPKASFTGGADISSDIYYFMSHREIAC